MKSPDWASGATALTAPGASGERREVNMGEVDMSEAPAGARSSDEGDVCKMERRKHRTHGRERKVGITRVSKRSIYNVHDLRFESSKRLGEDGDSIEKVSNVASAGGKSETKRMLFK